MAVGKLCCAFCKLDYESSETGPLLKKEDVCAHELCMLYSSNLTTQNSPVGDDLVGFLLKDVKEELKRGRKLRCPSCKRNGATIGCEIKKCPKSYHYLCAKKEEAVLVENEAKHTFELYCKKHVSRCPTGSGNKIDCDTKEFKAVRSPVKSESSSLKRNRTVKSRKRKRNKSLEDSDSEFHPSSCDSETTDDSIDYDMPKNHTTSSPTHCHVPEIGNEQSPSENHQYENGKDYSGEDSDDTHVSSVMDENEEHSESNRSESILDPMLLMTQRSTGGGHQPLDLHQGKEAEFWQLCQKTGCVEKIFSKITAELTTVSMKITNHSASENDYKFAFAVVMASGLLPQITSENEAEIEEKLENMQKQQNLLTQAKSAMQEMKAKMNQWQP
ncbi:PHD finger protein 6-like [Erpetoichthys calabaricus]|uniref:PHD finger protein 6-like n=1 Tax=Erpetoichthys calabaricus TaxID=27687 RepID=UPI0022340173|nr:PHD finger protein 6-like [Erpetoichthys calabaricus]